MNTIENVIESLVENIFSLSLCVSLLILTVLILRLILKKAPKWVNVFLWGIVAFCLIALPLIWGIFNDSSTTNNTEKNSLPNTTVVFVPRQDNPDATPSSNLPDDIQEPGNIPEPTPELKPQADWLTSAWEIIIEIAEYLHQTAKNAHDSSLKAIRDWSQTLLIVWIFGTVLMLAYATVSNWRLHREVTTAVRLKDNIFQSENVGFPFVFGIIRPRIYLPFRIDPQELEHAITHEQAHIRRKDHWWKPLGFLLLSLQWFNPLMWLAYILLCRDIELACDEKVIQELGCEQRADYTQALVSCSVKRHMITACPLAFGAVGVKDRVKAVMNYRKPRLWIKLVSIITCVALCVSFIYLASIFSPYKYDMSYPVPGGRILLDSETGTVTGYVGAPTEVKIPAKINGVDVVAIAPGAFRFCASLNCVNIEDGVKTICAFAFAHCPNLTNIDIPNSVDSIGRLAFRLCESLTSISLPEGLRSIDNEAFAYCSGLTSVTIPASAENIGPGAFFGCSKLEAIRVAEGNPNYYSNENGVLFNKEKTVLHTYPAALEGSYTVPSGVIKIGAYAFSGCSLSRVIIPNSVTGIDTAAFYHCSNLTHITLPDTITAIGSNAFFKCISLSEISFGGSATKWGQLDKGNNSFSGAAIRCTVQTPDFVF